MTDDGPEWWEVIGAWVEAWRHIDEPDAIEHLWAHCSPPLRLVLATRWVGVTTGEIDPLAPETAVLHPQVCDAYDRGPLGLVDFGIWLSEWLGNMAVTGHGTGNVDHDIVGGGEVPVEVVRLDDGRLDLAVVEDTDGHVWFVSADVTGELTPV